MRSPVGELVAAAGRALARPRNDAPVPYVAQRDLRGYPGSVASATGDQAAALEASGQNGTLFAIIEQLSTGTAAVDWHMHRTRAAGGARLRSGSVCEQCEMDGVQLVEDHSALSVWNKPNDFFTPSLFVETFQQHLDLVGEAWWVIAYLAGKPIELWPVRPDRMAPVRDPKKFIIGYVYRSPDGQLVPLQLKEVVPLRKPAPWDPYRGAGAVQTLLTNLYGAKAAAEWNTRFFQNSAIPGGVIEMPVHLSATEWEEFQQRWAESHRGVSNAHTVATLEHGAKWIDTKYTQKDMEFAELRRVNREEIREAFAMHGHVLGLSESVNRANAEAGEYGFAKRHIEPRSERIKDALDGPFLRLFGDMGKGYAFAFTSPIPEDREGNNAERESKARTLDTLVKAGADWDEAVLQAGLPPMKQAPKPVDPKPVPGVPRGDDGAPRAGRRLRALQAARR
jgi:HK97 family phage portal protein